MKLSFLLLFLIPFAAFSQSGNSTHLDQLKEDDIYLQRLSDFIPYKERYTYPKFKEGRVFYVPHRESNPINLNYNQLLQQMEMIAETRDTIFVANFEIIKYILIDTTLYYHDFKKGYYELLGNLDDSVRLAKQRWLDVKSRIAISDTEHPQLEAYKNYFRVLYRPLNQTLHDEVVKLSREVSFFLIDQHDEIHTASKSALLKIFPTHKQAIIDYLKRMARQKQAVSFERQDDLKKLLAFCLGLR